MNSSRVTQVRMLGNPPRQRPVRYRQLARHVSDGMRAEQSEQSRPSLDEMLMRLGR